MSEPCKNFVEDPYITDDVGEPKGQCVCGYKEADHVGHRVFVIDSISAMSEPHVVSEPDPNTEICEEHNRAHVGGCPVCASIEREQVVWVFSLTGGELADKPWQVGYLSEYDDEWKPMVRVYWYEGAPEYAKRELEDAHGWDAEFRTVVTFGGGYLPHPDKVLVDVETGDTWRFATSYNNSGETECPGKSDGAGVVTTEHTRGRTVRVNRYDTEPLPAECVLCEEPLGGPHGVIYINDGYEAVYCRDAEEDDE